MSDNRWSIPLDRLAAQSTARVETVVRRVTLELFVNVVRRSPVRTGQFRGNWNVSYGEPNLRVAAGAAQSRGVQEARRSAQLPVGGVVFLGNGLPYAGRLENGWSRQAPYGMVKLAAAQLDSAVRKALTS